MLTVNYRGVLILDVIVLYSNDNKILELDNFIGIILHAVAHHPKSEVTNVMYT
jgi:hypothetical protein